MRMHSALHLLSVVLPYGVTGGSIGEDKGRLDFDMPEPPEDVAALEARLNAYVAADLPVGAEWISEEELAARPEMVKTMKVKPPVGQGRVRLVRIGRRRRHHRPAALRRHARALDRRDRPACGSAGSRRRAGRTGASTCTSPSEPAAKAGSVEVSRADIHRKSN